MDHNQFQEWLSGIDSLSPAQIQQAQGVLPGKIEAGASPEAIETRVTENRQCPHCNTPGAVSRGMARGLRHHLCKVCKKIFNAATSTALQGHHKKDRWLTYGGCLADGLTVRTSAERCNLAVGTAFRWRHRFLGTQDQNLLKFKGIVEADETCVLESRKGDRNLDRKARRRGGKASKPCLSDEQVPILVAVDRSGTTTCSVFPSVTADSVKCTLEPRIDDDILLVTDGATFIRPA